MSGPKYPMGKVSRAFFETVIARHLGTPRKDVAVGPANGVDVGVVRLPDGRALVSTTDPIYIVPQYGWERAAWFAFHILASDLTTSGVAPQYVTMDWNLPMDIEDGQIETMLQVIDRECKKYGASIVTGHTGRYEGCAYPMVGGATFLAVAPEDGWVTSDMARPGNRLLVTKTAALEATAILTNTFPAIVERHMSPRRAKEARALFESMSTVDDALTAAAVGLRGDGVWAMHDATEGGVRNAVWEMAQASGLGVDVDLSAVPVDPAVAEACAAFHMDTLDAISEGTLLIAVDPASAAEVLSKLKRKGIHAADVGAFGARGKRCRDRGKKLRPADRDPFWIAFSRALSGEIS
ncbi:MAG TPA: AIR synthase family protein [Thermoplasmata archaeon]|jgi:hydrogenase maturation factor|nr:AIR synthase family protein [Thermoplasmata archaeon]